MNTPNVGLDQSAGARNAAAARAAGEKHDASPSATKPDGQLGVPTHFPPLDDHTWPGQQHCPPDCFTCPDGHPGAAHVSPLATSPSGHVGVPTHALPVQPCPGQQQTPPSFTRPVLQPALLARFPKPDGLEAPLVVVPPDFFTGAGQHPSTSFSDAGHSREHDCASAYVQPDTDNHSDTTTQNIRTSKTPV